MVYFFNRILSVLSSKNVVILNANKTGELATSFTDWMQENNHSNPLKNQ